jgi:hypothetical protein
MSVTAIMNTLPIATDANVDVPTDELDRALQNLEVKQRKPRKTKQRDPDAPKRPASAYMLWLNDNRASIKDELLTTNPDAKITDVTKRAGKLWNELSDDEKAPFQTASEELREKYHDAMKLYKPNHTVAKKSTAVKYDIEETPDAPQGWSGPFTMKYLYRKVKDLDGKHVRIQKNFQAAVELANTIIADWNKAKLNDSMPDHWKSDVQPCAGITKTSTGYDLRLGPDLMTTAEKDANGGLASWLIGQHTLPVQDEQPVVEPVEAPPVSQEKPPPKKRGRKPKNQESKPPTDLDADSNPEPKPVKKVVKKVLKKKTSSPTPVDIDQCQEIEIERDEQELTLLLHTESGMVYSHDNLSKPIAKADDDGLEFF